jgi:hypothetical protein
MELVESKDPNIFIALKGMQGLLQEADNIYEKDAVLQESTKKTQDDDVYEKYLDRIHL